MIAERTSVGQRDWCGFWKWPSPAAFRNGRRADGHSEGGRPSQRQPVRELQTAERPPPDCPILAFGGSEDELVDRTDLLEWRRHTNSEFRVEMFLGSVSSCCLRIAAACCNWRPRSCC